MLTIRLAVLCLIFSICLSNRASLAVGPGAAEPGWDLVQAHAAQKRMFVQLTSKGIRIDSLRHTWSIVSKAPSWDAFVFSKGDKTICRVPYAVWSKSGFSVSDVADEWAARPKATSLQKCLLQIGGYKNLPVTVERWKGTAQSLVSGMFQSKEKGTAIFTLITTAAIRAPPQARELVKQFYQTPLSDGFPLRLANSSEARPMLDTTEIKAAQISPAVFDLPTGYKTVKTDEEVWMNPQDKQRVNDLGELMGAPDKP